MDRKTKKAIKELEERLEALVIAVPKEEAAYLFYLELARDTKHEGARKMFMQLADQENDHKNSLKKVVEDIQKEIERLKSGK